MTFHGRIPLDDVPAAVAAADIGIAPTRRDAFTDLSLSTKVYEYAAMGKPVVATRLPLVERTFPTGDGRRPTSPATARRWPRRSRGGRRRVARDAAIDRTAMIVQDAAWEQASLAYLALLERLIAR